MQEINLHLTNIYKGVMRQFDGNLIYFLVRTPFEGKLEVEAVCCALVNAV